MAIMQHRRSWTVELDDRRHKIDVVYAAFSGWMSIEIDGRRVARGWREWQTVFGGAVVSCEFKGHRVVARVTQPWLKQEYAFALAIDGLIQPGSDAQPEEGSQRKGMLLTIIGAFVTAVLIAVALQFFRML